MTLQTQTNKLTAFGDMIPKCTGHNSFEDRLFLTTNERGKTRALKLFAKAPVVGNTMFGVSCLFLLNLAAIRGISQPTSVKTREIEHIVVFNRSLIVENFCQTIQTIMEKATSRKEVIQEIHQLILGNPNFYYPNPPPNRWNLDSQKFASISLDQFRREISAGISWLSDDIRFEKIAKIFRNNHFHFLRLDLTEPRTFQQVAMEAARHEMSADTLYPSNIEQFLTTPLEKQRFRQSLELLRGESPYFIDSVDLPDSSVPEEVSTLVLRIFDRDRELIPEIVSKNPVSQQQKKRSRTK